MKVTAKINIGTDKEKELTVDFNVIPNDAKYNDVVKAYGNLYADDCCLAAVVIRLRAYVKGLLEDGVVGSAAQAQAANYDPSTSRARVPVDPKLRALRMATTALASKGVVFGDLPKDKQAACLVKCLAEVNKLIAKTKKAKVNK